jgi:hypothetical protein
MGQTHESPKDNNWELQNIETTTAMARVSYPLLSPLVGRRCEMRYPYVL